MKTQTTFFTAADGARLALTVTLPENDVRAVVVLSHGMSEHAGRYGRLARELISRGYAFYAIDHRAHGETAGENLGYLGDAVTFERVVDDIHEIVLLAKKEQPGKKVFLLGHSFGSFISQRFIERYGNEIDGCVLSGTAGPRPALIAAANVLASLVCALLGPQYKSRFLDNLAFGSYNKTIKNPATKFDWLSRDAAEVSLYVNDPKCGFLMTASFFRELFRVLGTIHKKTELVRIPRPLPVFLFAGDDDPVGGYGKTVSKLADIYRGLGLDDVTLTLYEGGRHEMFNETNRAEATQALLAWLDSRV